MLVRSLLLLIAIGSTTRAVADDLCRLKLSLVDAATGDALPGVVRVVAGRGGAVPLEGLIPRGQGVGEEFAIHDWFVLTEPREVTVPRGKVVVEGFHGLETELGRREVDLTGRAAFAIEMPLIRFADTRRAGLRNANTHVHLQKVTRAESDRYLVDVATADGLDLVFVSYLERAGADVDYTTNRYSRRQIRDLSTDRVRFDDGQEHRHNFTGFAEGYGHVMLLDVPERIQPVSIGPGIAKVGTDGIPLSRGILRARELDGTVIWCHNAWGLEDVPNWIAGRLHANNVFDGGTRRSYDRSFYRYLDCGIAVPFSTGTDWFVYDFSRVYVPAEEDLSPRDWLRQLAAGRSFITNGPLLEFTVAGQGIGETVSLKGAGKVRVKARGTGRVDFERIELVRNGEVVHSVKSKPLGGHFEAVFDLELPIDTACWLALRTPPPSAPEDEKFSEETPRNEYDRELFSHTSASFVDVAGTRVFDVETARSLIDEMELAKKYVNVHGTFADDDERRNVLATYDEAIATMRERIERAGG